MILMDLQQVMIANLMVQLGNHHNAEVQESMLRHMVLNSLKYNKKRFQEDFGELIICSDSRYSWRKDVFPYYKANRKEAREKSELNWNEIFEVLHKIREEIREFFPYKVITVEGAEADDIIGTIVHECGTPLSAKNNSILILSADKDFVQLHKYGNVEQFNPARKEWVVHSNPDDYLYQHILKGDKGDGIPNVLGEDNSLVIGTRQKPITKKRIELWRDINNRDENLKRNIERNRQLIDLTFTPEHLKKEIMEKFHEENTKDRSNLFEYFYKNKLTNLLSHIQEF